MKKIHVLLAFFALIALTSLCVFSQGITVTLNGKEIDCEKYGQSPVIEEGRTLVPLRSIFEALGASVEWNPSDKSVKSVRDDITVNMTVTKEHFYRNDEKIDLEVAAKILNGRTVVPVRAVAEAFDVDVSWDAKTRTVVLFDIKTAKFERGSIINGEYKNRYISIDYVLPEGFRYFTDVEIKSYLGFVLDEQNEEYDLEEEFSKYEFIASDNDGNNIQLVTEQNTDNLTSEQHLEEAVKAYTQLDENSTTGEVYFIDFGQKPFCYFNATYKETNQMVAVGIIHDRAVTVMITYNSQDSFEKMMAGFN